MVVSNVIKYCSTFGQADKSQVMKPFPVTAGYVNCPVIWYHKFHSRSIVVGRMAWLQKSLFVQKAVTALLHATVPAHTLEI